MSGYQYTDQQLNQLNQGRSVYSVNPGYVKRNPKKYDNLKLVVDKPKNQLEPNERNVIKTKDGQRFQVIKVDSDPKTGFDGMAVVNVDKILYN